MSWHFKPWSWELSSRSHSLFKCFTVVFLYYLHQQNFPMCSRMPNLFWCCCFKCVAAICKLSQEHSVNYHQRLQLLQRDWLSPLGHQLKSITLPILLAVIGALALSLVELVGFSSPFHYYWNFSKDGRSENSKPHLHIPWGQQHFNETFSLISLSLVIRNIRKIQVKNRYVLYGHMAYFLPLFVLFLQLMCPNYFTEKVFQQL